MNDQVYPTYAGQMPADEPAPAARGRAGERRASILAALRGARNGLGVKDLVGLTGLHDNTVRFHLDQLLADGAVDKQPGMTDRPGRPPLTYVARREPDEAKDNYALIARVLGTALAGSTQDAAAVARESGRAWGRATVGAKHGPKGLDRTGAEGRTVAEDWDGALDRLVAVQRSEGFSPELVEGEDGTVLRVHHCPFLALSREDRTLPCSVHLGLIEGALGSAGVVERLEPFVTPTLCVAHLAPGVDGGA